jgi:hypothetical protein
MLSFSSRFSAESSTVNNMLEIILYTAHYAYRFCYAVDFSFEKGMGAVVPTVVSDIVQSSTPLLSTVKLSPSSALTRKEESKTGSLVATASVAKDNKPVPVDTVKLSFQALQSGSGVKKDEANKVETKKEASVDVNKNVSSEGTTAKVQFVYNQKGDLITKYLDSSGELIYQVPSKLMLLSQEADSKSNLYVDTRV